MEASDSQVGALRTRLADSLMQKKEALGEDSGTSLAQYGADGRGAWRAACMFFYHKIVSCTIRMTEPQKRPTWYDP